MLCNIFLDITRDVDVKTPETKTKELQEKANVSNIYMEYKYF